MYPARTQTHALTLAHRLRRVVARTALAAVVALGACTLAEGQIISNLPGNDGVVTFINAPGGGSDGGGTFDSKAAGFTMPAGPDYFLDRVDLRLNFFNSSSVPVVTIYNSVGNNPSAPLLTLTNPAIAVGTDTFQFTPSSLLRLMAGETYWIVVTNDAAVPNSFQWMANSPGIEPTGLATSAGYRFGFGGPPPTGSTEVFNSYAVYATVVPEPGALALFGLGLLPLAAVVARRRKA